MASLAAVAESPGRMREFVAYTSRVFEVPRLLGSIVDSRHEPAVPTEVVMRLVFAMGALRIRSFNALDPRLGEASMQRLVGAAARRSGKVCSVDTIAYALHRTELPTARATVVSVVKKAERNKCFREGWFGALRFGALDGWEMFSSRERHCPACLTRKVRIKTADGEETVIEYYHRYVVALLLGEDVEVVLDMEAVRSADIRREVGEARVEGHEGEATAAKRLVARLRSTYGRWIDVLVLDALYANGPFLTLAQQHGFGVIAVVKKETDEPLKEALALWKNKAPEHVALVPERGERIDLWDCKDLETLGTYKGPIRVVRGVVRKIETRTKEERKNKEPPRETSTTWCFAVTGAATRLSAEKVVAAGRARWHIENTGFHQWRHRWRFGHVFTHGEKATPALLWIFCLVFNLLQLFVYRQLGNYGRRRGKDPTRTIVRLVDEMLGDYERLDTAVAWDSS